MVKFQSNKCSDKELNLAKKNITTQNFSLKKIIWMFEIRIKISAGTLRNKHDVHFNSSKIKLKN